MTPVIMEAFDTTNIKCCKTNLLNIIRSLHYYLHMAKQQNCAQIYIYTDTWTHMHAHTHTHTNTHIFMPDPDNKFVKKKKQTKKQTGTVFFSFTVQVRITITSKHHRRILRNVYIHLVSHCSLQNWSHNLLWQHAHTNLWLQQLIITAICMLKEKQLWDSSIFSLADIFKENVPLRKQPLDKMAHWHLINVHMTTDYPWKLQPLKDCS